MVKFPLLHDTIAPANGQVLAYDDATKRYVPIDAQASDAAVADKIANGTATAAALPPAVNPIIDARTGSGKRPVGRDELVINVRDHGATGGGSTDDTTAMYAARAAAGIGGRVYIPAGTYLCDPINLSVAGQEWVLAPGATIKARGTISQALVTISAEGVTVEGGKIDGNKSAQTANRNGITVAAPNARVAGVEVTNCYGDGIAVVSTTGALITGNHCHDNGIATNASSGIYLYESTYCRVTGNRCENNGLTGDGVTYDGNGVYLTGSTPGYNIVSDNQLNNNARRGVKVQQASATVTGNSCTGNWIAGIGVTNAISPQSSPTVITGNDVSGNFRGLHLDNCTWLVITGNQVTDSGDFGITVNLGVNNVTMTGNLVARSQRNGFHLLGVKNWTITGNLALDNGQGGVNRLGFNLGDDSTAGKCERVMLSGNLSGNSIGSTSQSHGFGIYGTGDRITAVGNQASNVATTYVFAGTLTNSARWANSGGLADGADVPWTTFWMADGAAIIPQYANGMKISTDPGRKLGFYGATPVARPTATADAASLRAALVSLGLIAP